MLRLAATHPPVAVNRSYRNLGLVNGDNGRQCTDPKTGNDSTNHHQGHACGKGLEGSPDEEDYRAVENGLSTTDQITDASYQKRGYERSDLKDGHHGTNRGTGRLIKIIAKVRSSVYGQSH